MPPEVGAYLSHRTAQKHKMMADSNSRQQLYFIVQEMEEVVVGDDFL